MLSSVVFPQPTAPARTINRTGRSDAIFCACDSLSSIPAGSRIKPGTALVAASNPSALAGNVGSVFGAACVAVGSVVISFPQSSFSGHDFGLKWVFLFELIFELL